MKTWLTLLFLVMGSAVAAQNTSDYVNANNFFFGSQTGTYVIADKANIHSLPDVVSRSMAEKTLNAADKRYCETENIDRYVAEYFLPFAQQTEEVTTCVSYDVLTQTFVAEQSVKDFVAVTVLQRYTVTTVVLVVTMLAVLIAALCTTVVPIWKILLIFNSGPLLVVVMSLLVESYSGSAKFMLVLFPVVTPFLISFLLCWRLIKDDAFWFVVYGVLSALIADAAYFMPEFQTVSTQIAFSWMVWPIIGTFLYWFSVCLLYTSPSPRDA